jgi:hypothetical protein
MRDEVQPERSGEAERQAGRASRARVEIVAYAPTEFFHCRHCEDVWTHVGLGEPVHAEQRASLLPPDLEEEYQRITDWVAAAQDRYGARLDVRVIDAASVEGVAKALRHRLRTLPAFVINGREKVVGFDSGALDGALARNLGEGDRRQDPRLESTPPGMRS